VSPERGANAPTLEVFVWGLPQREPHHTLLLESLAESDVGEVTWLSASA